MNARLSPKTSDSNLWRTSIKTHVRYAGLALIALAVAFGGLPLCSAVRADEAKEPRPEDVKLLQAAGVASDGPALLEFFQKRTASDKQPGHIQELIKQLGASHYLAREKASKQLIDLGHVAVPALQQALRDTDREVVGRADHCLKAHKDKTRGDLLAAAVRVLTVHKSPQAVNVLLAFLPHAADPDVEEEIARALAVITARDGKADPLLVQALSAKLPLVRAAAGHALAGSGLPEHREAVHKLLDDPQPSVRLRVCIALIWAGEKEAVRAVTNLEGPYQIRSVYTGGVLSVAAEGTKNGAKLIRMTANASKAQQWLLLKSDKYYVIINLDSGKVLNDAAQARHPTDFSLYFLGQMNRWDHEGIPKEQWSVEKWLGKVTDGFQPGDYRVIRSRSNGKVLEDGCFLYPHSPGSPDQLWELIPVK